MRVIIVFGLSIIAPALGIKVSSGFFWLMYITALVFDIVEQLRDIITERELFWRM